MYLVVFIVYVFFFFKQKTAYEMRISDWSSDVCSSDLDSTHDAENELDEEWRLHQPLIDEIGQIVEMADVIAFMLELATLSSHCLKYISYILERVPEDIVVAAENIGLLPIMLPLGDALGRIEERSEERRVGKECVNTCRSRWSPYH